MSPRLRIAWILAAFTLLWPCRMASAQGFIVDRRPHMPIMRTYEVREVSVDARIRDQVADVQVSQTFHNPGSFEIESEYLFPMPEDGAIQNFVLMVDGREMPGRLLPKDEARRIYEDIVRTKRDPALLEYMGRGLFRTSVFPIPAGADRKVTLRYTQLLKRERDVVEFTYPFGTQKFTAKPIRNLTLNVSIDSADAIKSLYSPSHDAAVTRSRDREASVKLSLHDIIPENDFRLVYTLKDGALGATVLSYRPSESDDGYFLLLASPEVRREDSKPLPKTVVFVLDRSGSMSGKKIEQARNALKFVLDNLRDDDMFNIVVYDDRVETFRPELQRFSKDSRADAQRFVDNIRPGGSTNIADALKTSLDLLKDDSRPNYVLFLTDGIPTAGETRETAIAEAGRRANRIHARVFSFGVGYDVNSRLLDRLGSENSGTTEYVKPDEDIESHVSRFYSKMTSPVLTGLKIEFANTDVNRTYPRDIPDLFDGGQLVLVGRYRQAGRSTLRVSGKVGNDRRTFEFPAELAGAGRGTNRDYVEKLWAVRRVGYIIDQIDLNGQNRELTDELVALSTKYGILTPYTSFLADERVQLHAMRVNSTRTAENLSQLSLAEGQAGVEQRSFKGGKMKADRDAGAADNKDFALAAMKAPAASPASRAPSSKALGGGMGGGAMGRMPTYRGGTSGYANYGEGEAKMAAGGVVSGPAADAAKAADYVRRVGAKTFFWKENRWVDSEIKPGEEAKVEPIVQFSDEYFKLARSQTADMNKYLTFDDSVTVKLDGKVYRIDAPKKN